MSAYEDAIRELGFEPNGPEDQLCQHLSDQDTELIAGLVRLREAAGFTREDIARAWGVPIRVIEDFESPGSDPRLSTVRRYAAAIGVRYHHLSGLDAGVHPPRNERDDS
ncbi:helix-turn-helix domain-containing protein [Mycolicibacterium conceptionense]|uniref:helix-turn-helix domain-containing protein n=1 Tax=Mycolicibacterium conceptionense TaxID=451644 RepID=UPI000662A817|nr:helix-turn-helix transcriptional regulator [Mycolicibacterium conceptionense]